MQNPFFDRPIVNSPYEYPHQHWELDSSGQPTGNLIDRRRRAEFITPIPKPKKRKGKEKQEELLLEEGLGLTTKKQAYDLTSIINEVRTQVDTWRHLAPSQWQVSPETSRLLQHWRHHAFGGVRPFFCQVEAVETAIWFTEVAPHTAHGKKLLENLKAVNAEANPNLERLALKLATGAGKTTVMAMLIAWQTLNAVRRPGSKHFTRGFLIVTPGLTIKDRLRVLQPNDPDNYYGSTELVHSLLAADLVDEIRTFTFPVLLGKGKRLFDDSSQPRAFTVTHSAVSPNGVIAATYVRDGEVKTATVGGAQEPSGAELVRREKLKREG